jgi:hypothetical protein
MLEPCAVFVDVGHDPLLVFGAHQLVQQRVLGAVAGVHHGTAEAGTRTDLGCGGRLVAFLRDQIDQRLQQSTPGGSVLLAPSLAPRPRFTCRFHGLRPTVAPSL